MQWRSIGLTVVVAAALAVTTARGDVVHLKDGTTITGDVKRGTVGYLITLPDGKVQPVAPEMVQSIEVGAAAPRPTTVGVPAPAASRPADADEATRNLASLRRSVENLDDPKRAIEKYQRFIEAAAGTPAEVEARKDLVTWQDRAEKGLVRVGTKWVTPAERTTMQERAIGEASTARLLLRQGKLPEAAAAIDQALADDPQNAATLYLRGLLQYRKDQVAQAKSSFEAVNRLVPGHAPTLNNLAVIAARQSQPNVALGYYDQAMTASPRNQHILDNVAEALYTLPEQARNSAIAQRVARKFAEQDAALATEMEKRDLRRWGATWVTTTDFDRLSVAEKETRAKLDQMASDFDTLQVRLNNIDRDIQENNRAISTLGMGVGYSRDAYGQLYTTDNTTTRRQLDQDNQRLMREREDTLARMNRLREQAKGAGQGLPVPKYTGIQRLMDENFAPVIAPRAAESSPTTDAAADRPPPATQPAK